MKDIEDLYYNVDDEKMVNALSYLLELGIKRIDMYVDKNNNVECHLFNNTDYNIFQKYYDFTYKEV